MNSYCSFDHLYSVIAGLTTTDLEILAQSWGQMASRVSGLMVSQFWADKKAIEEGMNASNYYDIGYGYGEITSYLLDTKF